MTNEHDTVLKIPTLQAILNRLSTESVREFILEFAKWQREESSGNTPSAMMHGMMMQISVNTITGEPAREEKREEFLSMATILVSSAIAFAGSRAIEALTTVSTADGDSITRTIQGIAGAAANIAARATIMAQRYVPQSAMGN